MLPLPVIGLGFAIVVSDGEALQALGRGLSLFYAVFSHDCPVCDSLELAPEEERAERDLVRRDPDDPELSEERLPLFAERLHELVVGGSVAEDAARVAVDVREREVDLLLRERVERGALREDAPELLVVALDVGLLRGAVGVAEEDPRPPDELVRVVDGVGPRELDALGVRELRAVVREDDGEHPPEEPRPRRLPDLVEDARARPRGLRVPQEREHQLRGEHEREEDLPAHRAEDRVELDGLHAVVGVPELAELAVGAADPLLRARLRLGLPFLGPALVGRGQVSAGDVEEAFPDVPVDAALPDAPEHVRVAGHDVPDGLPPEDAGRQDAVHVVDPGLPRPDAAPRPPERPAVVGLRRRGDVEALRERAAVYLLAPVADVGGRADPEAGALPELVAALEAPREVLVELLLGSPVSHPPAGVEVLADAVRASVAPVAGDAPCEDLPRDRRFGASHLVRDFRDLPPEAEQKLDPLPFVQSHVFRHGLLPPFGFSASPLTRVSGTRPMKCSLLTNS